MHIVITGDLKSSRKIDNRYLSQDNLKNAIQYLNSTFRKHLISEFRIVGGDGFQGMISRSDIILEIYFSLFQKIKHPFYLGVGIGSISTQLSDFVQEIDGEAFHLSSEALNFAKKKNRWFILRSNLRNNNDLIECVFNFMFEIIWKWTERRREIILFYRNHGENPQAIEMASIKFETGTRNIYKTLEVGQYNLVKYGETVLKRELMENYSF
jgi:hypothetical protein